MSGVPGGKGGKKRRRNRGNRGRGSRIPQTESETAPGESRPESTEQQSYEGNHEARTQNVEQLRQGQEQNIPQVTSNEPTVLSVPQVGERNERRQKHPGKANPALQSQSEQVCVYIT